MKKILVLVFILICFFVSSRSEEGDAFIQKSREDAIQSVFQQLNKIYPGLTPQMIQGFEVKGSTYHQRDESIPNDFSSWRFDLWYDHDEAISTSILINADSLQIMDYTPWDFAAIISEYHSCLPRETAHQIAMDAWISIYPDLCKSHEEKYTSFCTEYGEDALSPSFYVVHSYYLSPLGPGCRGSSPEWHVFLSHLFALDEADDRSWEDHYWFGVQMDAKTGEIVQPYSIDPDIFVIHDSVF